MGLEPSVPPVYPQWCKARVRESQGLCSPMQDERVTPRHLPLSQAEQEGPCPSHLLLQGGLTLPRFQLCCLSSHSLSLSRDYSALKTLFCPFS